MPKDKKKKGAPIASVPTGPPRLLVIGKTSAARNPGQWRIAEGMVVRQGRPTTAGHLFHGECTLEGVREGKGTEYYPNGNRYVGNFKNGVREGSGVLVMKSGTRYEGDFSNGRFHGQGTLTTASGAVVLQGTWHSGRLEGHGKAIHGDGSVYEGTFEGGLRHGSGRVVYADGSVYKGEFAKGFRHGKGILSSTRDRGSSSGGGGGSGGGNVYEGEWRLDMREGHGTVTYPSGASWTGLWAADERVTATATTITTSTTKTTETQHVDNSDINNSVVGGDNSVGGGNGTQPHPRPDSASAFPRRATARPITNPVS